jgi:hydrogenase expression/formation protein HypE
VIAASEAQAALSKWRALPQGRDAALIGHVDASISRVVLATELGGARYLEELEDDPLPRIC